MRRKKAAIVVIRKENYFILCACGTLRHLPAGINIGIMSYWRRIKISTMFLRRLVSAGLEVIGLQEVKSL